MANNNILESLDRTRKLASMKKTISKINYFYDKFLQAYSKKKLQDKDLFFRSMTEMLRNEVKKYIQEGKTEEQALKKVLPKAYGLVKLACKETLGKTYYDVQLMSGILLNEGYISEMATGEGKTITAALPVYLNALLGKGAHVVTPNVYLAARDYEEMKPLYETLGLTCGLVEELKHEDRVRKISQRTDAIVEAVKKKNYYSPAEVEVLKRKAWDAATKQIKEEEMASHKKQYKCDVTYGSSHAFAFDYLFDLLEDDPKKLRLRLGQPNFIIVDEADAVLFDDAVTSYRISGTQEDSLFAISKGEKLSTVKNVETATNAMNYIMSYNLIKSIPSSYDYHKTVENDLRITSDTPAIYYCPKTKEYHITDFGDVLFYQYFKTEEMTQILKKYKTQISRLTYKGEPLLTVRNGRDAITPKNLAILIQSNKIKELSDSFEKFMLNEHQIAFQDITNAAYAWLFLKKDVDYKYTIPQNRRNDRERKISLIMDGRVADGRVYSNGMQQAVEAKEKVLIRQRGESTIIKDSVLSDTLASIPVAAFYGRYDKFTGMTGTSCKEAFRDLYGLETFTVPRNKPYRVKDHGDRLYATTEEKYKAILNDVIKTHKKGQPILLTTTTMGDSLKLYNYLMNGLKRNGINVEIPVLNANVDVLRKEARIISRAGRLGAITIATDMAGRGTDIKLGGPAATKEDEKQLLKLGGLKIIGSGHFPYNRSDRQMKGRTGRQGNVGEVVFYNDLEDLRKINVNPKVIESFKHVLKNGPINEETMGTRVIRNAVEEAQEKKELFVKDHIQNTQRYDIPVAYCRNKYHDMMEKIKLNEDYKPVVKKMIKLTIDDILRVSTNTSPIIGEISNNASLNLPLFQALTKEYLGFTIKKEAINKLGSIDKIKSFTEKTAMKRLDDSPISKKLVDSFIHRIWFYFEEYVEDIKTQYGLACMVPGNNAPSKIDGSIYDAYMYAYHTVFAQTVRETLHNTRNKDEDHFGIYKLQINSDATLKMVNTRDKRHDKENFFISDEDPCTVAKQLKK